MSPDEALRLSLNQPDDTPVLDEFVVQGKPLPVWPLAIIGALLLASLLKDR